MPLTHVHTVRFPKLALRPFIELGAAALFAYFAVWIAWAGMISVGRLAAPAIYDDVSYFIAGQAWLNSFSTRGAFAVIGVLDQHAPLSTLVAGLSFALLGREDWAPYLGNSVLLAAALWALMRVLRAEKASLATALAIGLAFASTPLAGHMVSEFRPELFAGLLSAFVLLLLFRRPIFIAARRKQIGIGVLAGFALLAKPSAFLAIAFIIAAAFVLSTAGFALDRRLSLKGQAAPIARAAGWMALGAAVIFLPYLLIQGSAIYTVLVAQSDYSLFAFAPQAFFVYAADLQIALGLWLWAGLAVIALRLWQTWRTAKAERFATTFSGAMLLVIYVTLTFATAKNYFEGGMLYAAFALLAARDAAWLVRRAPKRLFGRYLYPGYLALGLCTAIGETTAIAAPASFTIVPAAYSTHVTQMTATVWAMINAFARQQAAVGLTPSIKLLSNAPEPVRDGALELQALRVGLDLQVERGYFLSRPDEFLDHASRADLIVVASSANAPLPGPQLGDAFQQAMGDTSRFRLIQSFPGLAVQSINVYQQATPADQPSLLAPPPDAGPADAAPPDAAPADAPAADSAPAIDEDGPPSPPPAHVPLPRPNPHPRPADDIPAEP